MWGSLFDEVLSVVKNWEPKARYPTEAGYRDDLAKYLREELNRSGPFDIRQRRHKVKMEHGRSLAGIAVDEKVGIELKKDLKTRPVVDRLSGQVRRFRNNYSDVIVVLCGKISEEAYDEVLELERNPGPYGQGGNVVVVRKEWKERESRKRPKSFQEMLEDNPFF